MSGLQKNSVVRYAYFPGCKIAHHLPEYGASVHAVCAALGIGLEPVEFNCCGWPVRHESFEASMFSAARNLALAARAGLAILTPCKCCFGNLQHARHRLRRDAGLRARAAERLREEGLALPEDVEVVHLLTALDRDVGAARIAERSGTRLRGVRVACHYGCHALRPGNVTHFDDPLAPTIFERVLSAAGAEPVHWDLRLECCGHPLRGREEALAEALMRKKLENAAAAGADVVATACTYCQLQFAGERAQLPRADALHRAPPAVLFTQLLGLALGLGRRALALDEATAAAIGTE